MTKDQFDLYSGHYGHLADDAERAVRLETYDEDLGQSSWITAAEAGEWFRLLGLATGRTVLEVACGSGGMTCHMAARTGARCTGIDINENGIAAANARAREAGLSGLADFRRVDAGRRLPFEDASFDAIFCNDSINHIPGRADVLSDWRRVLRPGGRLLFTDPIVVTGQLTGDEMRVRSAIGFYLFTPAGENERLLAAAGYRLEETRDVTGAVASISGKWRDARAKRRDALVRVEGQEYFDNTQRFLDVSHTLASERRLSRFMYLATCTRTRT